MKIDRRHHRQQCATIPHTERAGRGPAYLVQVIMSNLDSFMLSSRSRPPQCSATSQEIRDRGSLFVANIFPASTVQQVRRAVAHLKNVVHGSKPATHDVAAWRCMVLKEGKTGLGGPDDFELITGSEDDGEKYAGGRILRVMQAEGVIDAVVVVSRWYVRTPTV